MRHLLANIATYGIATLLIVGAALFAWMRTSQLSLSTESVVVARYAPSAGPGFEWRELGERSYVSNCSACHRPDGDGWDQYPPIACTSCHLPGGGVTGDGGRIAHALAVAALPERRDFLVDLHLYGLASDRWRAPMPPMGHIPDVEMAAMLNYVLTRFAGLSPNDSTRLYTPDDIAARRGQGLDPAEVNRARPPGPRAMRETR